MCCPEAARELEETKAERGKAMSLFCDNCKQEVPRLWTSRKMVKPESQNPNLGAELCDDCLYEIDGYDKRGKSMGQCLAEIEEKRA